MIEKITFVVIGKNEATNLPRCFRSILKVNDNIIFVDSDSDDDSISIAKKFNIKKIIKVKANYGTPALSRSVGSKEVETEFIQFLDGDMTIDESWIPLALKKLEENEDIAAVHGYKKVFTKNEREFFILADSKDWQPDYMQGAYLIKTDVYNKAGGLDSRFPGEEERDLYVRIRSLGFEVWYLHHIMASHYDFKRKNTDIKHLLFSDRAAIIWIPLVKAVKARNFKSYLFVYRRLLVPLLLDISTILSVCMGLVRFILFAISLQTLELIYVFLIKRRGYFITWKAGFINILKAAKLYRRKIVFSKENF